MLYNIVVPLLDSSQELSCQSSASITALSDTRSFGGRRFGQPDTFLHRESAHMSGGRISVVGLGCFGSGLLFGNSPRKSAAWWHDHIMAHRLNATRPCRRNPPQADSKIELFFPSLSSPKPFPSSWLPSRPGIYVFFFLSLWCWKVWARCWLSKGKVRKH